MSRLIVLCIGMISLVAGAIGCEKKVVYPSVSMTAPSQGEMMQMTVVKPTWTRQ